MFFYFSSYKKLYICKVKTGIYFKIILCWHRWVTVKELSTKTRHRRLHSYENLWRPGCFEVNKGTTETCPLQTTGDVIWRNGTVPSLETGKVPSPKQTPRNRVLFYSSPLSLSPLSSLFLFLAGTIGLPVNTCTSGIMTLMFPLSSSSRGKTFIYKGVVDPGPTISGPIFAYMGSLSVLPFGTLTPCHLHEIHELIKSI